MVNRQASDLDHQPPGRRFDVSVVIPAVNEGERIGRAVNSALQAGVSEVIVVDGGSHDDTREIAESQGCRVLESAPGRGVQQNLGARHSSSDVLLFQHADAWLDASVPRQIEAAMQNPRTLCGAFCQRIDAPGLRYRSLELGNAWRVRLRGLAYGDQGIFLRRSTFFELGQFPEEPILEDLILMRAARRIARPVLLPGPIYVDPRRWTRGGVLRQTIRNWSLITAYRCGVTPVHLARYYRRHDV